MKNLIVKVSLIFLSILFFMGCRKANNLLDFKKFNKIVMASLDSMTLNDCFELNKFERLNNKKVFGFVSHTMDSVRIENSLEFENFEINSFIQNAKTTFFHNDTFVINNFNNYIIFPTTYKKTLDFIEYHKKFDKFRRSNSEYDFIKTIIVKNPKILYKNSFNLILIEYDRLFEYVIDKSFVLITTDNKFNIIKINCLQQKKLEIPKPINK